MANQTVQQPVNPMRNRATASAHETVRPNRAVLELLVNGRTKYIKFLLSRLRDRDVAEEIFQQLIIKILERKSQLRSEARAEAWIYRFSGMPSSITIAAAPEAFSPCKKVAANWRSPLLNPRLRCVPALRRSWSNSRPSTRTCSAR